MDTGYRSYSIRLVVAAVAIMFFPNKFYGGQEPVEKKTMLCKVGKTLKDDSPGKSETGFIKTPKSSLNSIIIEAAERHDMDPAMIKAIIMAESGFDRWAVSKRGAMGLMQLMPGTAESLGVSDSFNPEQNINGGVMYFRRLLNRFDGTVDLALAAYNCGSRNVRKYGGIPPFKATRIYIRKVRNYYRQYKNIERN